MIPFSLMWGGFAIFWEVTVVREQAPFFFWLWGIPFVLVGLYMIFGRFLVAAREVDNTFYAVTNERVLIQTGAFSRRFAEVSLSSLPSIEISTSSSGIGTIYLGKADFQRWFMTAGWSANQCTTALNCIDKATEVYQLIDKARRDLPMR